MTGVQTCALPISIRIRDSVYGTRCSTLLSIRNDGEIQFHERSFTPEGDIIGTVSYRFSAA